MMKLNPPQNKVETIAYQTLLPYYSPDLIERYEAVVPGTGKRIFTALQESIAHLTESQKKWERIFPKKSWTKQLKKFGYNISGKYAYTQEAPKKA
jgi:uncharacterized membrane protein